MFIADHDLERLVIQGMSEDGRIAERQRDNTRTEQAETSAMAQDEKSVRDAAAKFTAAMEAVKAPYIAEKQKLDSYGQGL